MVDNRLPKKSMHRDNSKVCRLHKNNSTNIGINYLELVIQNPRAYLLNVELNLTTIFYC